MDNPLEYIVYGKTAPNGAYAVLSHTPNAPLAKVTDWQKDIPLLPLPAATAQEPWGIAMIQDGDDYVMAVAFSQQANPDSALYIYLLIPAPIMTSIGSDIQMLQQLAFMIDPQVPQPRPLRLSTAVTWTAEKRIAVLNRILAQFHHQFEILVQLMDAALQPDGLVIQHYPADEEARLSLVQGMMLLLPLPLRSEFTFTTYTPVIPENHPRIVFSDAVPTVNQRIYDARMQQFNVDFPLSPYAAYLLKLWQGDMALLVEALRIIDRIATYRLKTTGKQAMLQDIINHHQLENAVLTDAPVDIPTLLTALESAYPPPGELRLPYLERLLRLTLEERHTAAAERIAQEMDADPFIDEQLEAVLEQYLDAQPDAVYAFLRPNLSEHATERWFIRLHAAAARSVAVAVSDGDTATLSNWLKLIAREPAHYHLENILRDGILAALQRTPEDPQLAVELLTLAIRRIPDIVPMLLNDPTLLNALPSEIYAAVVEFDPAAIEELANSNRELFLLALHESIHQQRACISVVAAQLLWEIYQNRGNFASEHYHPATVLRHILKTGSICLEEGALEVLITAMLADQEDAFFQEVAPDLAAQGVLQPILANALEQSGRTNSDVMTLLNQLTTTNVLNYREQIENYVALLLSRSRNGGTPLLIEQLARLLHQHSDVSVPPTVLWMMLDIAAEAKSDQMMRVALKRLMVELNGVPSEAQLAESLLRLRRATTWSSQARTLTLNWWRDFAGTQPLGKLQKLEKALEGKKGLEEMRGIVQTALAIRRVLGQKSLDEFAREIGITYRVLQTLADGFDPEDNKQISIDTDTLRTIIAGRADELPPDVKQVLATNFRALADLIVSLAENRSKPSLLNRNDEAVYRALLTGEHEPDGAVDVMKFLSGLLDGTGQHKAGE